MVVIHLRRRGLCPSPLRDAVVHPLFKKPSLDTTPVDSFCPISKLPFLEKVVEKMVALQLQTILGEMNYQGFRYGT